MLQSIIWDTIQTRYNVPMLVPVRLEGVIDSAFTLLYKSKRSRVYILDNYNNVVVKVAFARASIDPSLGTYTIKSSEYENGQKIKPASSMLYVSSVECMFRMHTVQTYYSIQFYVFEVNLFPRYRYDVTTLVQRGWFCTRVRCLYLLRSLLRILLDLYSSGLIHGDIKLPNILCGTTDPLDVRLGDLEVLSYIVSNPVWTSGTGTISYMSPNIRSLQPGPTHGTDAYATAMCMCYTVTHTPNISEFTKCFESMEWTIETGVCTHTSPPCRIVSIVDGLMNNPDMELLMMYHRWTEEDIRIGNKYFLSGK